MTAFRTLPSARRCAAAGTLLLALAGPTHGEGDRPEPARGAVGGTLAVASTYDTVEIEYTFPYAALPPDVREGVLDGEGTHVLARFALRAAAFEFPTWARCHIEDQRSVPAPALMNVDAGPEPADRAALDRSLAAEPVRVSYEYHCDGILSDRRLDALDVMLFVSMPDLATVSLEVQGRAADPITEDRHRVLLASSR